MDGHRLLAGCSTGSSAGETVIKSDEFFVNGVDAESVSYPSSFYGGWAFSRSQNYHASSSWTPKHSGTSRPPVGSSSKNDGTDVPGCGRVYFEAIGSLTGDETSSGYGAYQISSDSLDFMSFFEKYMAVCLKMRFQSGGDTSFIFFFALADDINTGDQIPAFIIDSDPDLKQWIQRWQSEQRKAPTWREFLNSSFWGMSVVRYTEDWGNGYECNFCDAGMPSCGLIVSRSGNFGSTYAFRGQLFFYGKNA